MCTESLPKSSAATFEQDKSLEISLEAQYRDQGFALLKLMNLAERDIKADRVLSTNQAKLSLREFFKSDK